MTLRATLDKGSGTKNPGTNFKQIEPWIGPFFTLKKTTVFPQFFQWACLKGRGLIWGFNIKNVWLTCERIKLIFGLFSLFLPFFHGFYLLFIYLLFLLHTMDAHKILVAFVFTMVMHQVIVL
jgi:hypothetical protein